MIKTHKLRCPVCDRAVEVHHDDEVPMTLVEVQIDKRECDHDLKWTYDMGRDTFILFTDEIMEAEYEARDAALEQLTAPGELLDLLRKMDLNKIGYIFLSMVGEAEHGGWDGHESEDLPKLQYAYNDLLEVFKAEAKMPMPDYDWGFGGPEYWDPNGKRHAR